MEAKTLEVTQPITELMQKLKEQCLLAGIPCFVSIAVGDYMNPETNEKSTKYISEIVSPVVAGTTLIDDKITKMLNIMNGYDVVDPNTKFEINF